MQTISMTQKEVDQVPVFALLIKKEITQLEAAGLLKIGIRQVKRKLKDYKKTGAVSLPHQSRGRPGNRQFPASFKELVLTVVRREFPDFAPTFAAEKLFELHGLRMNKETLRQWMAVDGLWEPKAVQQKAVHTWRERRACFGELIQLDGSYHHWFEDRSTPCCLLAFIDDATSSVVWAEFCDGESTDNLMRATLHYLEAAGRPIDLYTDRGGVYKVNLHNGEEDKETQYERALGELRIGLIHARSPQAKGRIERLFGTLQDRLVKELRLRGISSIEAANQFLQEEYICLHNAKFSVLPRSSGDLHRTTEGFSLPGILCTKEDRTLQSDWCISYYKRWLQLTRKQPVILAKGEKIQVSRHLDGSLHLHVRNQGLAFTELTQRPTKPLKSTVGVPKKLPTGHSPAANHPWREFHYLQSKRDISKLLEGDISILV